MNELSRRQLRARRASGQRVVVARLTPRPVNLDLGGPIVDPWAYGGSLPGPLLRAMLGGAGDIAYPHYLVNGRASAHRHAL